MKSTLICLLMAAAMCASAENKDWDRIAGFSSGITTPRTVAVSDIDSWRALWKEHTQVIGDQTPLPEVDFNKEMVVAVFLGERRTGGYQVALDMKPTSSKPPELLVIYSESKSGNGSFATTGLTYPFEFRKIPKTCAEVRFVPFVAKAQPPKTPAGKTARFNEWTGPGLAVLEKLSGSPEAGRIIFDGGGVSAAGKTPIVVAAASTSSGKDGENAPFSSEGGNLYASALPPPPGGDDDDDDDGRSLPPPPGGGNDDDDGKGLPPPPGGNDDDGKPLPPPPGGGGGKPLPPPPGIDLPRPIYPGGPLSPFNRSLKRAERIYFVPGRCRYLGFWFGETYYKAGRGYVNTTSKDKSNRYILNLDSGKYLGYKKFYWDPEDGDFYYTESEQRIGSKSRRIVATFTNRDKKSLLPWEKERFTFSLTGTQLKLDRQAGSYRYRVTYMIDSEDPRTVNAHFTAGARNITAPDPNGVTAGIMTTPKGIKLMIQDKWAKYYPGETLEVAIEIKWDKKWTPFNPILYERKAKSNPIRITGKDKYEIEIPSAPKGKGREHWIKSWSFRRANSKVSSDNWIRKGKGNTVTPK